MNKSYSKLRHIQTANLILESRFVTEQQAAQTQDQVSQVPYELPQNQRQLKQNIRQATRDENKANREAERERAQAKRTAKSNYDAQMKSRQEMEKKLADYENMVKSNSESVKPYLPQYNKAIADLKAQLGQQPATETQPVTGGQPVVAQPAVSQQTSTPIAGTTTPVPPTAIPTKSVTRINTAPTLSGYDIQTKTIQPTTQPVTGTQSVVAQPAVSQQTSTPTTQPAATAQPKMNTTNDRAFDYKLENGRYFFKGKPNTSYGAKYPDWKETTADSVKNLKFT